MVPVKKHLLIVDYTNPLLGLLLLFDEIPFGFVRLLSLGLFLHILLIKREISKGT